MMTWWDIHNPRVKVALSCTGLPIRAPAHPATTAADPSQVWVAWPAAPFPQDAASQLKMSQQHCCLTFRHQAAVV